MKSKDGTNHELDLQNPDNLGRAGETDNGVVPNLKWSFSDSHTRLFKGGWIRESVVTDLPSSPELAAAQLHLTKGAIRELHWHSVVSARGINPPYDKSSTICSQSGVTYLPDQHESPHWMRADEIRSIPWRQVIYGTFRRDRRIPFNVCIRKE